MFFVGELPPQSCPVELDDHVYGNPVCGAAFVDVRIDELDGTFEVTPAEYITPVTGGDGQFETSGASTVASSQSTTPMVTEYSISPVAAGA